MVERVLVRRVTLNSESFDYVVVGGGIVGLTIARQLLLEHPARVLVLEKEAHWGAHASGRNSGVLHAGIYYTPGSLKARVCVRGKELMEAYAEANGIPWRRDGKVIVATATDELAALQSLHERALANSVQVERISPDELREIEPEARTVEWALHSPGTSVIDPRAVLAQLAAELESRGATLLRRAEVLGVKPGERQVETGDRTIEYGHLVNCAGLHADRLAHSMGVAPHLTILPFRGGYRRLRPEMAARFRGSIYPVPDMRVPFLGVHVTPTIDRQVTLGPTSMPAFGREHYHGLKGVRPNELASIAGNLAVMVLRNRSGMRALAGRELAKHVPGQFLRSVQALAPAISAADLEPSDKVGLRAQLVDRRRRELVFDFVVEPGPHSTHVLNAASPAFTASMAFAELVVERIRQGSAAA